jgi:general secretion pathway protein N
MICRGILLALTAGVIAFAGVRAPALAATDPTAVSPSMSTINPPLADPAPESVRPAAPVARAPSGNPPSGNPLWAVPLRSLSVTRQRPIFSPSRRPPPPAAVAAPNFPPPPPAVVKPAEPDHPLLSLVGTIVGKTESIGVFVDGVTQEVVRLRTGQDHAGWTLRSVQGREAAFEKGAQTATLALPPPGAEQAGQPLLSSAETLAGGGWMDGDGQIISPPKRTPQPGAALPPGLAPVAAMPGGVVPAE